MHKCPSYPQGAYSVHETDFISKSKPPIALTGRVDTVTKIPHQRVEGHHKNQQRNVQASAQLQAGVYDSAQRPWPEGEANAKLASRPLAHGLERSPGQRFPAGRLWGRSLALQWGGPGFKFRVTVSVAPRPEDSEAK